VPYVIVDRYSWDLVKNKQAPGSVYVWKTGNSTISRFHGTQQEAVQNLIDYIASPWKTLGVGSPITTKDFLLMEYNGPLSEEALDDCGGWAANFNLTEIGPCNVLEAQYGLTYKAGAEMEPKSAFAAVLKEDYNGAKMSGKGSVTLWCTGPSENRHRLWSTKEEAEENLRTYIAADWDGCVEGSTPSDFVIVKVLKVESPWQSWARQEDLALAIIVSEYKVFTSDDELF
jgi:hypothetical protein